MRIGFWSDLHGEFYQSPAAALAGLTIDPTWDVLVIAGDLGYIRQHTPRLLREINERFAGEILFVAGNHEYYRSQHSIKGSLAYLKEQLKDLPRVHILNNEIFEWQGQRFLGTTMWFRSSPLTDLNGRMLNDYSQIEHFPEQLRVENQQALEFLQRDLQENDIVVTHHLPSSRSEVENFRDIPTSIFFVCDMEYLIAERKPKIWLHGHTHSTVQYEFFGCQVYSNPRGYPHDLNPQFQSDFTVLA